MDTTANHNSTSYTAPRKNDLIWNILTFAILISTVCLVGIFSIIYIFPRSAFNPFPPSSPAALIQVPATPTDLPTASQEAATPLTPTETSTTVPAEPTTAATEIPTMEVTVVPLVDTSTPQVDPGVYPFDLRNPTAWVASTIIHPDQNCAWQGIGGQVFDRQGAPLLGVSVLIGGKLNGKTINLLSLTGTSRQYGEAGYEFQLAEQPVDSNDTLWIQILDQAQLALSPRIPFSTFSDCQKNLVLINFRQVR